MGIVWDKIARWHTPKGRSCQKKLKSGGEGPARYTVGTHKHRHGGK
jgi:hypothetical protein